MRHAATLALLVAVLVLGGCTAQDQAGHSRTAVVNEGAQTYFHTGYGEEVGVQVEVRLSDGRVDMPPSLPAGPVTFVISNEGDRSHCFGIEGRGLHAKLDRDLAPGEVGQLTVRLATGTYRVQCPLDHHDGAGIDRWLRVAG